MPRGLTDEALAIALVPENPCLGLVIVARLSGERRYRLEHLAVVAEELRAHDAVGRRRAGQSAGISA